MVKGVIFDNDGVLVDSERYRFLSFKEYLETQGVSFSNEQFYPPMGRPGQTILASFYPHASPEEIEQMIEDVSKIFLERYLHEVPLVPGIREFIDVLRAQQIPMVVVSNGVRRNVEPLLARHNIDLELITIEDFTIPKPHPAGYLVALGRLGTPPTDTVVFEDSQIGIRSARKAHIPCIGVETHLSEDALLEAGAYASIADFTDTKRILGLLSAPAQKR